MISDRMRTADFVPGVAFVILGSVVAGLAAQNYSLLREGGRVGSGLLPFITGLALAVIGAVLVVRGLRSDQVVRDDEHALSVAGADDALPHSSVQVPPVEPPRTSKLPAAPLLFVLLAVSLALVPVLGHFATFGLFTAVVVTLVERRSLLAGVLAGTSVAVVGWAVFALFLSVQTAEGLLP